MDKKELEHRLDRLCSTLVRCKETRCFTCHQFLRYADRQAGHYIPRVVKACRWDLHNIHTQCYKCNVFKGGNMVKYQFEMQFYDRKEMKRLDEMEELYRVGQCPEPTYDEKVALYNTLLERVKKHCKDKADPFEKWQELK